MSTPDVRFRGISDHHHLARGHRQGVACALEDPGFRLVTGGGFGVHQEVEAQAVVVQASHQVVVIGVGDHSQPEVASQHPQRVRHLGEDHRRRVHVRVCVGELPGRRFAAKWREQSAARRQPRRPVRHEARSGIPGRSLLIISA